MSDHIILTTSSSKSSLHDFDSNFWYRIDVIVLQWIYSTISIYLLNTILEQDTTAKIVWNRLQDMFFDNRNSRALYLELEFFIVHMENFTGTPSYCQHIKSLVDQLSNIGALMSNDRLVLQLLVGLTDAYTITGSQIWHCDSFPLFYKAHSMVVLEEIAHAKRIESQPESAVFFSSHSVPSGQYSSNNSGGWNNSHGGHSSGRGTSNSCTSMGKSGGSHRNSHRQQSHSGFGFSGIIGVKFLS